MQDNTILLLNVSLYVLTFIIYIRKNNLVSLGTGVLALYAFSAFMTYGLYNNPLSNLERPTIVPFVYLYIFLLLFFIPLLRFDSNRVDFQCVSKKELFFINIFSVFIFFFQYAVVLYF